MLIYKILTADQWAAFQAQGMFTGAPIDIADGFIHFSTRPQAAETAAKHFAGATDLMLAWGKAPADDALKWEVSRGGQKFPHLYRDWLITEVVGSAPLPFEDGKHRFPQ